MASLGWCVLVLTLSLSLVEATTRVSVATNGHQDLAIAAHGTPGCATASFDDSVNSTGWAFLTVKGNESCSYGDAAYAMGYAEGYLTQRLIWDAFVNFNASNGYLIGGHLPHNLSTYVQQQLAWMEAKIAGAELSDYYWNNVNALLQQAKGIQAGYQEAAPASQALTAMQVYILAMAGDLEDLASAFADHNPKMNRPKPYIPMDCSGLVKLAHNRSNLFTGHSTFNAYWAALRVFKRYTLNHSRLGCAASTVTFSSRPGDLHSKDDFFLLSSNMTVIETSLTVFNKTLYQWLVPQTVPTWLRSQLANRLATSASDWTQQFIRYNSGTHNNEWIVTDFNRFVANRTLPPNTVWMLEQMVQYSNSSDMTETVNNAGYIASYNIPYFSFIFDVSGYAAHGYNYTTDPRAQIFHRDHVKVVDLDSMCALMNSNDYKNDPLSKGDPCNQISARCDLPPASGQAPANSFAFGGIDSKNVDASRVQTQTPRIISGMSYTNVPQFQWDPQWLSVAHQGMPQAFNFTWLDFNGL
eukprot:m.7037 g.7037  ORF g.7037 m.7037 type:complete len:525 (-) comp5213_c0_seq1:166-1740(-)